MSATGPELPPPGRAQWPLLVLGALTLVGGWLQLPDVLPFGRVAMLHHWLAPVIGNAGTLLAGTGHLPREREFLLIGIAVAVAVGGIAAFAVLLWALNRAKGASAGLEPIVLSSPSGGDTFAVPAAPGATFNIGGGPGLSVGAGSCDCQPCPGGVTFFATPADQAAYLVSSGAATDYAGVNPYGGY